LTGALAPTRPLTALDVCDRCGAQAYVRVLLANSGELLFCAHHGRLHAKALAEVAVDIQDETNRLSAPLTQ
jgi:acetyl-CoA carboxylase beta subunit